MPAEGTSLRLPPAYGTPSTVLRWEAVERLLAASPVYWLVTVRADGRPHAVPVDGVWFEGAAVVGGDPATVHERNLRDDPRVALHTESGQSPVIVEGEAERHVPDAAEAARLAAASNAKYAYGARPESYLGGVWRIRPRVVLAWTVLYEDATRFAFGSEQG
jgi:Pyridoxamine 5'-phosphate oxidase